MSCCSTILCNTDKQNKTKKKPFWAQTFICKISTHPLTFALKNTSSCFVPWPLNYDLEYSRCFIFLLFPSFASCLNRHGAILILAPKSILTFYAHVPVLWARQAHLRHKHSLLVVQNSRREQKNTGSWNIQIYQLHTVCMRETENKCISYPLCALEKQIHSITIRYALEQDKFNGCLPLKKPTYLKQHALKTHIHHITPWHCTYIVYAHNQ